MHKLNGHSTSYVVSNLGSFAKNCLNFHKINRCHYLLEARVIIPLFPNVELEYDGVERVWKLCHRR